MEKSKNRSTGAAARLRSISIRRDTGASHPAESAEPHAKPVRTAASHRTAARLNRGIGSSFECARDIEARFAARSTRSHLLGESVKHISKLMATVLVGLLPTAALAGYADERA